MLIRKRTTFAKEPELSMHVLIFFYMVRSVGVLDIIGALIIRIGFWSIIYHNYDKEPPK